METADIFISYSHYDGAGYARELESALTRRGFKVWLDNIILRTGDDLHHKIVPAIKAAGLYVPVITPQFCDETRWAYKEFLEAWKEENRRKESGEQETFIFPILHQVSGVDDLAVKRNPKLRSFISDRLYANSASGKVVVDGIVDATGFVEDAFVPTPQGTLHAGRFPVTNLEYRRFVNAGGYSNAGLAAWWSDAGKDFWMAYALRKPHKYLRSIRTEDSPIDNTLTASDTHYNKFNQPVTGICYFEAEAYCNWLTDYYKTDRQSRIRLPTEKEWLSFLSETTGHFPWGTGAPVPGTINIIFDKAVANEDEHVNLAELAKIQYPSIYGRYPEGASYIGCHELIGNIWEWVLDFEEMQHQGETPDDIGNVAKIMGNCCFDYPSRINFPPRTFRFPGYRHRVIGFRIVREVSVLA